MFELPGHLHPMVVHFPVALFLTALFFELLSLAVKSENLHKAAVYLYVTAALITPLVVKTGMWEAERLHLNHPLLEAHEEYAETLMWAVLMSLPLLWFIQKEFKKYFQAVFILALIAAAVLVTLTGDKGGRMVYEYGVGVEK